MEENYQKLINEFIQATTFEYVTSDDVKDASIFKIITVHQTKSAQIIFAMSEKTSKRVCIKVYKNIKDVIYAYGTWKERVTALMSGYTFGKQMHPDIYLGIAKIISFNNFFIKIGKLKQEFTLKDSENNVEYALIMQDIPQLMRSDFWLKHWGFRNIENLHQLASQMSSYHNKYISIAPSLYGTPDQIHAKLIHNKNAFVDSLSVARHIFNFDSDPFYLIPDSLEAHFEMLRPLFQKRHRLKKIKRCHGDIKRKNIYMIPSDSLSYGRVNIPKEVKVLDCIDFKTEYYMMDPISDIAMLVADIYLSGAEREGSILEKKEDASISYAYCMEFLYKYLEKSDEFSEEMIELAKFYIMEKLFALNYDIIMYEKNSEKMRKYLSFTSHFVTNLSTIRYTTLGCIPSKASKPY